MSRSPVAGWTLTSAILAPILLIGGWTLAAALQPSTYDPITDTISALAGYAATDRWVMASALFGLGLCHIATAAGLPAAAVPGRLTQGVGGISTCAVAFLPLSVVGSSIAHGIAAGMAFVALAIWPALAWRTEPGTPWVLTRTASVAATVVLLVLVALFEFTLAGGVIGGLTERLAAGAQALWPLIVVVVVRRQWSA